MSSSPFFFCFLLLLIGCNGITVLRPNIYFGTRSPSKLSHLTGIMWFEGSRLDSVRHECKREDDIRNWIWTEYDGIGYGKQRLTDVHNYVKLNMRYLKSDDDWMLEIDGKPMKNSRVKRNVTLIFYLGVDGESSRIETPSVNSKTGTTGPILIPFYSEDYGDGHIRIVEDDMNQSPVNLNHPYSGLHLKTSSVKDDTTLNNAFWYGDRIKSEDGWRFPQAVKQKLDEGMKETYNRWQALISKYRNIHQGQPLPAVTQEQLSRGFVPLLPNAISSRSNFVAVQRVFSLPFKVTVFMSHVQKSPRKSSFWKSSLFSSVDDENTPYLESLTDVQREQQFSEKSSSLWDHFSSLFPMNSYSKPEQKVALASLSNLLAGVSFFYGNTVQLSKDGQPHKTNPGELITAIPGRSYFPRGFIWDEGFHELLLSEWNSTLSYTILNSWFNRMQPSGYIEREQILGDESRSRVPEQFIMQDERIANPPTLLLAVEKLVDRFTANPTTIEIQSSGEQKADSGIPGIEEYYNDLFSKVNKWISYIESSQRSVLPFSYRWFGRTNQHNLASGMDDFPRHTILSESESNVDLISWLLFSYETLAKMEAKYGKEAQRDQERKEREALIERLRKRLEEHWDDASHSFGDIGVIGHDENGGEILGFEIHRGYLSILPFALMLLDEQDPRIPFILDDMEDPEKMWSSFGLRSLSKSDEYFGKDEDYWRGHVWININYLVLRALYKKYAVQGPYKDRCLLLYSNLRAAVVSNVIRQFKQTGFFWENYDSITGKGSGVHPFTGWTSLIVLIMSEKY